MAREALIVPALCATPMILVALGALGPLPPWQAGLLILFACGVLVLGGSRARAGIELNAEGVRALGWQRRQGAGLPWTELAQVRSRLVLLAPSRAPGTVLVDAGLAAFGVERLELRQCIDLIDHDERIRARFDSRLPRFQETLQAILERAGLPLSERPAAPVTPPPLPAPHGSEDRVDHLGPLLQQLRKGARARRLFALRTLGRCATPAALLGLAELLTDPDAFLRQQASGALLTASDRVSWADVVTPALIAQLEQPWGESERLALLPRITGHREPDAPGWRRWWEGRRGPGAERYLH